MGHWQPPGALEKCAVAAPDSNLSKEMPFMKLAVVEAEQGCFCCSGKLRRERGVCGLNFF